MALFEVAILEVPSKKDQEDGVVEKLAFGPKFIIANDAQSAAIKAVMANASEAEKIDQSKMQVLVRPFV